MFRNQAYGYLGWNALLLCHQGIENMWVLLLLDTASSYCHAVVWLVSNAHPATHSLPQWEGRGSTVRKFMGRDGLLTNQSWGQNRFSLGIINCDIVPIKWETKTNIKTTFLPTLPDLTSLLHSWLLYPPSVGSYSQSLIVPFSCSFLFTLFPCSCMGSPWITVLIEKHPFAYSRVLQGVQWGHLHCCGTPHSPFSDLAVPFVLFTPVFLSSSSAAPPLPKPFHLDPVQMIMLVTVTKKVSKYPQEPVLSMKQSFSLRSGDYYPESVSRATEKKWE